MTAVVSKLLLALVTVAGLLVASPPAANAATCPAWSVTKRTSVALNVTLANGTTTRRVWTLTVRKKGTRYIECFGNTRQAGYAKIQWRQAGKTGESFWYTDNSAVVDGNAAYVRGVGKYRGRLKYTTWVKVRS